ncbi:prolipoprotein diacylglyceryl transferase [Candidatus Parcubacteria bacterium]|nr:prolipoprotein diacylglyceryl transferase [Candidatus Parcubacteria bacterium]
MIPYFSLSSIIIGPITIQVWGSMVALGFLVALFLSLKEAKKNNIDEDSIWALLPLLLLAMVIGSKLFYIIFNFHSLQAGETLILLNSGFSLIGGLSFSVIVFFLFAKAKKINVYKLADSLIPGAILAIIITRIGCFLVYEHIGAITTLPWGRFYVDGTIRHPVNIYYMLSGLVIFLIICYLKRRQVKEGMLAFVFLVYYMTSRFLLDFTRCSDLNICNGHYIGLTNTQWILLLSLPLVLTIAKKKRVF